jgi:hypothetical protein
LSKLIRETPGFEHITFFAFQEFEQFTLTISDDCLTITQHKPSEEFIGNVIDYAFLRFAAGCHCSNTIVFEYLESSKDAARAESESLNN